MLAKVLPNLAPTEPKPFTAYVSDDATNEAAARAASQVGIPQPLIIRGTIADAIRQLGNMPTPKLLVVDLSGSADPLADIGRLAEVCDEGTQVVTVGEVNDIHLYRSLVGVGVHDYLVKPVAADALAAALARAEQGPAQREPQAAKIGRLIAVVGARGGVGATAVAVNAAWMVAHEQKVRTALVDLDLFFGTCGLALNLELGRGFREALENPSRIDGLFIERAMVRDSDNLYVLSAEEALDYSVAFDPTAVELLIDHLRRDFACVVLDLPRFAARTQCAMLTPPSTVVVVSDPSLAGMRDTMRLVALLKKNAPNTDMRVVLNRVGISEKNELSKSDFQKGAEAQVDYVVPFDPKPFADSAGSGKPLAKISGGSKATQAMRTLTTDLVGSRTKSAKAPIWRRLRKERK